MRIPIPRFIINVKIMILNQGNRRSSMLQFETKMASCVLYRSHLWNHLKWITTFLSLNSSNIMSWNSELFPCIRFLLQK
jgi:hypothetical protein